MEKPIEKDYVERMNTLTSTLDSWLNEDKKGTDKTIGFAILVFPFIDREDTLITYSSNAEKSQVVNLMKEFIARAESRILDSQALQ